jgi:DnaA family protein
MKAEQLPLGIRLRDSSIFASYFAGRNRSSVESLRALIESHEATKPTCIWLHGAPACGKTHLLQAACVASNAMGRAAAYIPLRDMAMLGGEMLGGYGTLELVCLDDAEAIAGRSDWERALFRLHQELDERAGRLLVSGCAPPAALGFKLPDLASRLNGGLVLTLHALDEREQIGALQLRAKLRGFELPEETAQYLFRRLPRDMASLCAFLDELDQASLVAQRRLTIPFVREVMSSREAAIAAARGRP